MVRVGMMATLEIVAIDPEVMRRTGRRPGRAVASGMLQTTKSCVASANKRNMWLIIEELGDRTLDGPPVVMHGVDVLLKWQVEGRVVDTVTK